MTSNKQRKRRGKGQRKRFEDLGPKKVRLAGRVTPQVFLSPILRHARAGNDFTGAYEQPTLTARKLGVDVEGIPGRETGLTMHTSDYVAPKEGLTVGGEAFPYEQSGKALTVEVGPVQDVLHLTTAKGTRNFGNSDRARRTGQLFDDQVREARKLALQETQSDPAYA